MKSSTSLNDDSVSAVKSIEIPTRDGSEVVEVFLDELPEEAEEICEILVAEEAPIELFKQFAVQPKDDWIISYMYHISHISNYIEYIQLYLILSNYIQLYLIIFTHTHTHSLTLHTLHTLLARVLQERPETRLHCPSQTRPLWSEIP